MAADGNVQATTKTAKTFSDVLEWIDTWRREVRGGRDHMRLDLALSMLGVETSALTGMGHAVFCADRRLLLLPPTLEEPGEVYRWAIGLAVLAEIGVLASDANVVFGDGDNAWDVADQIGAALLVDRAFIERHVPKSLRDLIHTGGSTSYVAIERAVEEIVNRLGGEAECELALGVDFRGTLDEALFAHSYGGGDVTAMLGGQLAEEFNWRINPRERIGRAALALGHEFGEWLRPSTCEWLDIVRAAEKCGVRLWVKTGAGGVHVVAYDDGVVVVCKLSVDAFVNGKWNASACTDIATAIGVTAMIRGGLISPADISRDDIDYGLAGEIGAFAIVPKGVVDVAASKISSVYTGEDFALRLRDELIRSNRSQGYDLAEIFHVVGCLTCGVNPYDNNAELVLKEVA